MTRRRVLSATAAAWALGLLSTPAHAQALDDVLQNYSAASSTWLTRVQPYALGLFVTLAVLELAVTGIRLALHHGSSAVLGPLLRRFLLISLGWLFLSQFPLWLPRITQGFASAGKAASGSAALSPSSILDIGISLSSNMLLASAGSGFLADPTGNIVGSIVALIVLVTFALIAAQLVLVLIESYIVLSAGILFLGFAGSRITAPLAERFFLYAIEVGIRLFFLYVLVAIGPLLQAPWIAAIRSGSLVPFNLRPFLEVLAGTLAFGFVVLRIPTHISARLTSGVSFGLTEALRSSD